MCATKCPIITKFISKWNHIKEKNLICRQNYKCPIHPAHTVLLNKRLGKISMKCNMKLLHKQYTTAATNNLITMRFYALSKCTPHEIVQIVSPKMATKPYFLHRKWLRCQSSLLCIDKVRKESDATALKTKLKQM